MEYSVLRGSNQIGGSVVEIVSKKGTKIWVDFGSELFFYAMLACDMRKSNVFDKGASYRGFDEFMASNKEKPVKAYFLAPSLHKEIMENLESILHMLSSEKDVIFDYIQFDQSQIVTEDTDRFLDKLRFDWEGFDYDR